MLLVVLLAALAVLILEVLVVVKVAAAIGFVATVLLLVAFSAGGAWIVKREGLTALRRIRAGVRAGRVPTTEVLDGALIVLAGALLLPPGFLTGALGLLLVIPPIRHAIRDLVGAGLQAVVSRRLRRAGAAFGAARGTAGAGPGATGGGASTGGPRTRAYRRPNEPPTGPSGSTSSDDVIDVDGEEIDLFGGHAELGPPVGG